MRRIGFALVLFAAAWQASTALGQEVRAITENGKQVILRSDGTWSYAKPLKQDEIKPQLAYVGKRGVFILELVPGQWRRGQVDPSSDAEVVYAHADGDVYGQVIAERIEIPIQSLKKIVLTNMEQVAADAKLIQDEKRTVNGKEVHCITVDATVAGIPLTYHCYLLSGKEGTFQVMTWTGRNLFGEVKPDMEAFLNGFRIIEKKD